MSTATDCVDNIHRCQQVTYMPRSHCQVTHATASLSVTSAPVLLSVTSAPVLWSVTYATVLLSGHICPVLWSGHFCPGSVAMSSLPPVPAAPCFVIGRRRKRDSPRRTQFQSSPYNERSVSSKNSSRSVHCNSVGMSGHSHRKLQTNKNRLPAAVMPGECLYCHINRARAPRDC